MSKVVFTPSAATVANHRKQLQRAVDSGTLPADTDIDHLITKTNWEPQPSAFNLAAFLADDALTAPIEELEAEVRAEGKHPADAVKSMRKIIADAQQRLEQ
ncbi:hypothetical protein [Pelagibacterium halotolerans]|uniref:Uncharacterized protein n=1 Tax=Pelagibacterium halotolerans (strain DSM 22347 / JCM 15775 / CGMCC 1.7692 / B2) TaxID=1082931 RepID=G4RBI9_PELHB|nr:hypothetical protein [Pelagibacterium halotolerans]AEQ52665.1 hypothetical protein KKY_2657 [Pelagibacterium halotolerans B2]QJR17633.1 hypothetical protein HKM20_03760 [Pelagibacterium halotolerans]SEA84066.1 hypothetical protein SAMN05428936_10959 [Pelagibacterium halotolerans]